MFRTGADLNRMAVLMMVGALIISSNRTSAAELEIADLMVSYDTQTATSASGVVRFNLRFVSLGGDAGLYDLFSAQILIERIGVGDNAKFSLDESATENTGVIGTDYWLPAPPTSFQNASTVNSEFRFTDFVSVDQGHTPSLGDVVAHFVINFNADAGPELGDYEIRIGDSSANFFNSDFVNRFDNTIVSQPLQILPVPEPATLIPLIGLIAIVRRRRARRVW